jgi:hypothetical protein
MMTIDYPDWTEEEILLLSAQLSKWGWTETDLPWIMKMYDREYLLDAARIYKSAHKYAKKVG